MKKYRIVKHSNGTNNWYVVEKKGLLFWKKLKWDSLDWRWNINIAGQPMPFKETIVNFGDNCYFGYNNEDPGDDLEFFYSLEAAKFFVEQVKKYDEFFENIKYTKEIIKV